MSIEDDPKLQKLEEALKEAREDFDEDYNPKPETNESVNAGARAGVELIGSIIGGGLIGYGLDYHFETSPFLFLTFLLLGVITGFYNIYKITMNIGTSVGFKGLKKETKDGKQTSNYDNDDDY